MFFHTEAWALPIGPQAKACGLLGNARQAIASNSVQAFKEGGTDDKGNFSKFPDYLIS